jgi:hypothetical protein
VHISKAFCPACGAPFPPPKKPKLALRDVDIMGIDSIDMSISDWRWREHVSKASGKPYNAFWAASHKTPDGAYCKDKPSQKFVASQSAAPAKPKLVPEDTQNLEDLPF